LIGGNSSVFYNQISVLSTWINYCARMDLTCANFVQLNCSHYNLMDA